MCMRNNEIISCIQNNLTSRGQRPTRVYRVESEMESVIGTRRMRIPTSTYYNARERKRDCICLNNFFLSSNFFYPSFKTIYYLIFNNITINSFLLYFFANTC